MLGFLTDSLGQEADLVVVMMLQGRGPKSETHMKMKNWPRAEATEKEASWGGGG